MRKAGIITGLALALGLGTAGCRAFQKQHTRYYDYTAEYSEEEPAKRYLDIFEQINKEDLPYSDENKEEKKGIDKLARKTKPKIELPEPYMITSRKTQSKTTTQEVLETLGGLYLGKMLNIMNHEENGHAKIMRDLNRPGKTYHYETAVNFGFGSFTSINLTTGKRKKNLGFLRGKRRSLIDLTDKEDEAVTLGGIWSSQQTYHALNDLLERNEENGMIARGAHAWALFSALDLPFHYIENELSPDPNQDIEQLKAFGHSKDIKIVALVDIIGKAPDLYWHGARSLGFDVNRPNLWQVTIPGTKMVLEIIPTAYIRPHEGMIAPGFRARIFFED